MAVNDGARVREVAGRLDRVQARIREACQRAGRPPDAVRLIAVGKRHTPELIRAAFAAGQRDFGENYMQELVAKASQLADLSDIRWRFVGRLQRNKAREAARVCAAVDTLDSARLAQELDKRAQQLGRTLQVLIQVNLASEVQKAGCAIDQVASLAELARRLDGLTLRGLMAIPPAFDQPEQSRPYFRRLRHLAETLSLDELSMGMSADLEVAIEEGATMVRVGTDVFGTRPPLQK